MKKPKRAGDDWHKQLRLDMQFAETMLMKTGEVAPLAVLHSADTVRMVPYETDVADTPAEFLQLVQLIAVAENAQAVSFMSEAWVAKVAKEPGEGAAAFQARTGTIRPSKSENRTETVYVAICYRDKETGERIAIGTVREIERRANGKPAGLKPAEMGIEGWQGRAFELMPEAPPTPVSQSAARAALAIMGFREQAIGARRYDA